MQDSKVISFSSNPPLDPVPHIVQSINSDGSPVNRLEMVARSNKSPFDGSHYDPQKSSLRAMINLGVQLQPVSYSQTENDPNKITASARRLISDINRSQASRLQAAALEASKSVQDEITE